MSDRPGIGNLRNQFNLVSSSAKFSSAAASLKGGTIVEARVISITDDGSAVLRLVSGGNVNGSTIKASSEVPLTKGQSVFLEIIGDRRNIQFKFLGEILKTDDPLKLPFPAKFLGLMLRASGAGLKGQEAELLLEMIRSFPGTVKNNFPELSRLETLLSDSGRPDIKLLTAGSIRNLLTIVGSTDKSLSIKPGTIVKAEVIGISGKGAAMLRLVSSGSPDGKAGGTIMRTDTAIPLAKNQEVFLEVLGGRGKIEMRFVDGIRSAAAASQQAVPVRFLNMLARLSDARPGNSAFHQFLSTLKSLPEPVKEAIPEFKGLEKLMLDVTQINGKVLKAFVETSGVAFETRLKIAVLKDPGSMLRSLIALRSGGDLKSLLLKLTHLLKDMDVISRLTQSGHNVTDLSNMVERFIKEIEFFQLTSRLNDMFYTFLPVLWDGLKDGELMFRRQKGKGRKSYVCDINLDLEALGRLSISITILNKAFYVTIRTERRDVKDLIQSQKHLLESRFASQGLPLKAINFRHKENIAFGKAPAQGINVKI